MRVEHTFHDKKRGSNPSHNGRNALDDKDPPPALGVYSIPYSNQGKYVSEDRPESRRNQRRHIEKRYPSSCLILSVPRSDDEDCTGEDWPHVNLCRSYNWE